MATGSTTEDDPDVLNGVRVFDEDDVDGSELDELDELDEDDDSGSGGGSRLGVEDARADGEGGQCRDDSSSDNCVGVELAAFGDGKFHALSSTSRGSCLLLHFDGWSDVDVEPTRLRNLLR